MSPSLDWMNHGLCVTHPNPDLWFPSAVGIKGRQQVEAASRVCAACPVATQCRAHKERTGAAGGVWGGRTGRPKATSASYGGPQNIAPHGTEARAKRHRRNNEKPCTACRLAERRAQKLRGGPSEIGSKQRKAQA